MRPERRGAVCFDANALSAVAFEGVSRNEETLQPTVYLNKLPDAFAPDARVLVTDPMLATGARERLAVAAGCSS